MKWPKEIFSDSKMPEDTSVRILKLISICILLFGVLIVLLFGASYTSKATIFLWMLACLLTGAAIGFLFGIPKILQNNQVPSPGVETNSPAYQQQVNTNLTEISDWLTKIIVGLGLVNLTKIPPYLSSVAKIVAGGLTQNVSPPSSVAMAFAYGTIISYWIFGFLFGYITTRLYLAIAFSNADQKAIRKMSLKADEALGAASSALQKAELALTNQSDPFLRNELPEKDMEQLAQLYNNIRETMPAGVARTRRMGGVLKQMMAIASSLNKFDVSQALRERNNGKRLAGYAYLYIKPEYERLKELVDAFTADPTPFGQYWGIQAMGMLLDLQPSRKLDPEIFKKIKAYYDQLSKGIDREYELGKMLPELKK